MTRFRLALVTALLTLATVFVLAGCGDTKGADFMDQVADVNDATIALVKATGDGKDIDKIHEKAEAFNKEYAALKKADPGDNFKSVKPGLIEAGGAIKEQADALLEAEDAESAQLVILAMEETSGDWDDAVEKANKKV